MYYLWLIVLLRFLIPIPLNIPIVSDGIQNVASVLTRAASETNFTSASPDMNEVELDSATLENMAGSETADLSESALSDASTCPNYTHGLILQTVIQRLLQYIWLAGAAALLLWTVIGYTFTTAKLRHGRSLLMPGRIPVYENSVITTPVLAGLLHPTIYLPSEFNNTNMAIHHELMHLRRGDNWLKWIVQLTVCIHWFNPFIWLTKRKINRLMELACDRAAVQRLDSTSRKMYGKMLLDTARIVSDRGNMLMANLSTDKCLLKERLQEVLNTKKPTKKASMAMSALITGILITATLCGAFLSGCTQHPRTADEVTNSIKSSVSATFTNDPDILGTWLIAGYIADISEFDPATAVYESLNPLIFADDGSINDPSLTWTKGIIMCSLGEDYAYTIEIIDEIKYMFLEMPEDVEDNYLVLKWLSANSAFELLTDNIDLPFVDDPAVLGTWEYVDFVKDISSFTPGSASWKDDLYLKEMVFLEDGAFSATTTKGPSYPGCTWTKGFVLNPYCKTASAYVLEEINGTTYMFFEWKSGDYVVRHMMPYYYVLKKTS